MLAGHMLILTFIGLIFVLGNLVVAVVAVPAAIAFYLFEVVIVVSIQAYIFAALSAIYIGSASSRSTKEERHHMSALSIVGAVDGNVADAGKAIALALGIGPRLARSRHRHRQHLRLDDPGRRPASPSCAASSRESSGSASRSPRRSCSTA
jgi:hypothetical protein